MRQNTSQILMVRPASFQFNSETAASNEFQNDIKTLSKEAIVLKAQEEFDTMVEELKSVGIQVEVIQDTLEPTKPDAIFPNNWISMNQDNSITIFPMKNYNRQLEKRPEIIDYIKEKYKVTQTIDLSYFESEGRALEGTGSIVFDHSSKTAYACISPRTDVDIFNNYCKTIGYTGVLFHSYDIKNTLIYHTNVVMCIGKGFVVIGLNTIKDEFEKKKLIESFVKNNLEIIDLTDSQLNENFAGNMIQLENTIGDKYLIMSKRAYTSLTKPQIEVLSKYTNILPVSIDIIEEVGGGSARCMIAEIFLAKK